MEEAERIDRAVSPKADHLCVLVHGLWGNPRHLEYLRSTLEERYGKDKLRIVVATRNSNMYTYDGIEVGGERVAREIEEEVERLKEEGVYIKKLSMVGYSLGGLIARYTIGLLYSRGWFEKIVPVNFTTFASPHLGVKAPLNGYHTTAWNYVGSMTLSISGEQLFLADSFRQEGRPLLSILADPNSIFIKALTRFKRRTLYANIANDRSAPFYTTYISACDPFVDLETVDVKYFSGYTPVILDPDQPVQKARPREPVPFLTHLASRASSLMTQLPLYALLAILVPIGSTAFLINSGIQNFRSSQRIRLHEEGSAGMSFHDYRIPLMIENAKMAVEDAIEDVNGSTRIDYLTGDENITSGSESKSLQMSDGDDNSHGDEKLTTNSKTEPINGFPTLALSAEQFEMIKALDNVGFRKYPVWIHKIRHTHAAIVVRSPKKEYEEDILNAETASSEQIYFDGYLPIAKRLVGKSRLEGYLKQTALFYANHKDFQGSSHREYSFIANPTDLFDLSRPIPPKFRGLPAAPFLVPAVLDSLTDSNYAAITHVVPGEADSFCATAARASGGIVLTSDSDLLIHDLGPAGAVVFFDHLELVQCGEKHYQISSRIAQPSIIAQSLNLKDIRRFAFELKEDSSLTLQEVQRRTKTNIQTNRARSYEDFGKEYEEVSIVDATKLPSVELLDPRISEVILQCHGRSQGGLHMYMPFLIEDPSRSSAWNISIALRTLAYSAMAHYGGLPKQQSSILEHSRRDTRIVPVEIQLIDYASMLTNAESLNTQLEVIWKRYCSFPTAVIWKIFGMIEVFSWHLKSGRTFPLQKHAGTAIWSNNNTYVSWQDVQLSAQLQAALYSVRILKQVLTYVSRHYEPGSDTAFLLLLRRLKSFPSLRTLFPGNNSTTVVLSNAEVGSIFDFIRNSARKQENAELDDESASISIPTDNSFHIASVDDATAWVTIGSKHKKPKRQSKNSIANGPMSKRPLKRTNNIYGMLSDT
ncbi:hypothetical protein MMC17_002470 [Xylographa soralifera]|nr:hypothetical protein [Xylographa soralifera]